MKEYKEIAQLYKERKITREQIADKFAQALYWVNETLRRNGVEEFWDSGMEYKGNIKYVKHFIEDYKKHKLNREQMAKKILMKFGKKLIPYKLTPTIRKLGAKVWDLRQRKAPKEAKASKYFTLLNDARTSEGYAKMIYSYLRDKWK